MLLLPALAALGSIASVARANETPKQPNIVFFIVDDLDARMTSPDVMPLTKKHMIDQGTTYPRHYCTVSLCCPARASVLTGQNAHNHNVTDVSSPEGGWPKWKEEGLNDRYLPVFFQEAGYNTYYTGKLLNDLTIINFNDPYPAGWTGSEILLDPYSYDYLNPGLLHNNGLWKVYKNQYSTDLIANMSYDFLDQAVEQYKDKSKPFFLGLAPVAPHSEITVPDITDPSNIVTGPARPHPRHEDMFQDAKVPREANFNPENPSGASWVKDLPRLNETEIENGDTFYRARLQSLQAIDEMVDEVFKRLEEYDMLDDTYIVFTSDNGYHISQHRLPPGKSCGYEEDINVPLYIRGPGIPKNHVSEAVTAHIDLLPTFFKMAGISQREDFDGTPIPWSLDGSDEEVKIEHANIEMWKNSYTINKLPVRKREVEAPGNNTYKSVRLIGQDYSLYYSVWCTNEHEMYDMNEDLHQMKNLVPQGFNSTSEELSATIMDTTVEKLALRLDALLFVQKSCAGVTCRKPWEALLPGEGVSSLVEALDEKYDGFFEDVPKVSFSSCEGGHYIWAEGPQFEDWTGIYADGN